MKSLAGVEERELIFDQFVLSQDRRIRVPVTRHGSCINIRIVDDQGEPTDLFEQCLRERWIRIFEDFSDSHQTTSFGLSFVPYFRKQPPSL